MESRTSSLLFKYTLCGVRYTGLSLRQKFLLKNFTRNGGVGEIRTRA